MKAIHKTQQHSINIQQTSVKSTVRKTIFLGKIWRTQTIISNGQETKRAGSHKVAEIGRRKKKRSFTYYHRWQNAELFLLFYFSPREQTPHAQKEQKKNKKLPGQ